MQCQHVIAKTGKQCRGGAMRGQTFCGPHMDAGYLHAAQLVVTKRLNMNDFSTKPKKRFVVDPDGQKRSVGKKENKMPCPDCGLPVHITGDLISYHKNVNGCDAFELSS